MEKDLSKVIVCSADILCSKRFAQIFFDSQVMIRNYEKMVEESIGRSWYRFYFYPRFTVSMLKDSLAYIALYLDSFESKSESDYQYSLNSFTVRGDKK